MFYATDFTVRVIMQLFNQPINVKNQVDPDQQLT